MRACHRVGAVDDFEPRRGEIALDERAAQPERPLGGREPFVVVVPDATEPLLVVEIVARHQLALRLEVGTRLGHHAQRFVVQQHPVIHLRASGAHRRLGRRRGVRVDNGAQPQ